MRGQVSELVQRWCSATDLAARLDAHLRQFEASAERWQAPRSVRLTPQLLQQIERVACCGDTELPRDLERIVLQRRERALKVGLMKLVETLRRERWGHDRVARERAELAPDDP